MDKKYTADDLLAALALKHSESEGWAFFPEFSTRTGYAGKDPERHLDALAVGLWYQNSGSVGYEIKVTRADFIRDIEHFQSKQGPALEFCTQFYYAVPLGLVQPEEVPGDVGLVALDGRGSWRTLKVATLRDLETVSFSVFRSMARRTADPNRKTPYADFLKKCLGMPEITFKMIDDYIKTRLKYAEEEMQKAKLRYETRNWERDISEKLLDKVILSAHAIDPALGPIQEGPLSLNDDLRKSLVDNIIARLNMAQKVYQALINLRC